MVTMKNPSAQTFFFNTVKKSVVLEANRLEPRSGPTFVGPDFGSSLFTTVQNTA